MRCGGCAQATAARMVAALLLLLATAAAERLGDLARRDTGDVFTIISDDCGASQCAEHGAGTRPFETSEQCSCACPQRAPLFREDRELCVDDIPECSLATFGTGVGIQRIPFVFLPLKGQIIHPSNEITFPGVKTPICAVSGAQFLTRKGFVDLRNTLDADVPFSLFRDEGRTFLQWSGEDDVRTRMTGRVMVVRLLCKDVAAAPSSSLDLRGVFTPCVAFRVQGTPSRQHPNVTEVQFAPNAHTAEETTTSGLTVTEYVAIGISSLLLGLIYVASVFLYLHIRKRRKASSIESKRQEKGRKEKDGPIIIKPEREIVRVTNERIQTAPVAIDQDDGIVKKNPLMSLTRQFHEIKNNFTSDSSNVSDSEEFCGSSARSDDIYNNHTTSAVVHPHSELKLRSDSLESMHRDESGIERLPDEHVSIVETTDDREIARPVGTTRRKLYFNPAYFEPHLMAEPPPAALEFLTKIREVIAIAKHKMATKRFQPILNQIPEEETYPSNGNSIEIYQGLGSQRSGSVVSLKRDNSRKKSCMGCPGCKSDSSNDLNNYIKHDTPACSSCLKTKGDKQNSIREWLENIPIEKHQPFYNDLIPNLNYGNSLLNSLLSLPTNETRCKLRKQNTFSSSNSMYLSEIPTPKKSSTLSVRSEPSMRNYNLPLPELNYNDNKNLNYNYYCQTVSQVDDISSIGFGEFRSSLRSNTKPNSRQNSFLTNKSTLPDMVNEAIALDHCSKYHQSSSDDERFTDKVTDTKNSFYRNNSGSVSGNEYETDSLERTSNKKSNDYPEIPSSQASPSLSNALPLEEELTMRNAIYKNNSNSDSITPSPPREACVEHSHYEAVDKNEDVNKAELIKNNGNKIGENKDYSLVSEVYVNNNYDFDSAPTSPNGSESSMGSRKLKILKTEDKPGCLTIEVKDPPENYIKIHESDGFEPDTLDRKQAKQKENEENAQFSRKDLLKNIEHHSENVDKESIQLRNSGTFKNSNNKTEAINKFNSLRHEYHPHKSIYDRPRLSPETFRTTKSLEPDKTDNCWEDSAEWNTEEGRILTLELRHSKRQRQCTPPTIKELKNLARPDVLPPLPPTEETSIYEQPVFPPRRVEQVVAESFPKNLSGRSLSPRTFTKYIPIDSTCKQSNHYALHNGPSCSPQRASVHLSSSDYEKLNHIKEEKTEQKRRSYCGNEINTNTFIKTNRDENRFKARHRRKKGSHVIDDSGYLSSDSTSSRQVQRKIVVSKIVSCSESDYSENEARSESGAESVETHSVYFGRYRGLETNDNSNNKHFIKNSNRRLNRSKECSLD